MLALRALVPCRSVCSVPNWIAIPALTDAVPPHQSTLGLIGYGALGEHLATIARTQRYLPLDRLVVHDIDKNRMALAKAAGFTTVDFNRVCQADTILLCIKPKDVIPTLTHMPYDRLVVSLAAGVAVETMRSTTTVNHSFGRAMANMLAPPHTAPWLYLPNLFDHRVQPLLRFLGPTVQLVHKESVIDQLCVFSACSPAIYAKIFEEIIKTVTSYTSMEPRIVRAITLNVLVGTARDMMGEESAKLIAKVATKGGVTDQALRAMEPHLSNIDVTLSAGLGAALDRLQKK